MTTRPTEEDVAKAREILRKLWTGNNEKPTLSIHNVNTVAQALADRAEECAKICEEEGERRFANSEAAKSGSLEWGDPQHATMAQAHKAITATGLAEVIRSRFSGDSNVLG